MSASDQLVSIQQQKRQLQIKLQELNSIKVSEDVSSETLDANMVRLLQRKKLLQDKKREQQAYKKMETEYLERKKQVEREKELEKIKNQKRILQLEAGMKRIVFEGLKEKVKGMNSDQLMMRGFLADKTEENSSAITKNPFKRNQSSTIRDQFKEYLQKENPATLKPKYDIHELNEKRLQLYEQKQQAVLRQLLLKELAALDEPPEIDAMRMDRKELELELSKLGVDAQVQEYMHPVRKEDIIQHYPAMEEQAKMRIEQNKKIFSEREKAEKLLIEERKLLRSEISNMNLSSVEPMRRLLYELIDSIILEYQKRHIRRTKQDHEQKAKMLSQEYEQLFMRTFIHELSNDAVDEMLQKMRKQMVEDAAQQIWQLHQLAHERTEACFKGILNHKPLTSKLMSLSQYNFPLTFTSSNSSIPLRNTEYLSKFLHADSNIYQTQTHTTPMLHDISFLDLEQKYFDQIDSIFKQDTQSRGDEAYLYEQGILYGVGKYGIKDIERNKVIYQVSISKGKQIVAVKKCHGNWMIVFKESVLLVTKWNQEEFESVIGSRISNPCGNITQCDFAPILTLLGSPCSLLFGFANGQILKYNLNFNRLTSAQTSLTHYVPIIQNMKTGDEPGFPLQNRNYIQVKIERGKGQMHQFREFFDHHQSSIVFIGNYKYNKFITVDKNMKCALWEYDKKRGTNCYVPMYKFQVKSTYYTFKEDENPRFKDIYPSSSKKDPSPEEAYVKYLQTEQFLKRQLYNNPKKQIAYFKAESWESQVSEDRPIWKITYDDRKQRVDKILESYYNATLGNVEAKSGKLWKGTLLLLCQREHVLRHDLKTVKIYGWEIQARKLSKIGIQMDLYKDQNVNDFAVLQNVVSGVQLELLTVVSSGRVLVFSLVSGQLLRNLTQEEPPESKFSKYYFRFLVNAPDQTYFYAMTSTRIVQVHLQDHNDGADKTKMNSGIEVAKRKYF